ncbi:MAG: hypothetical protein WCH40_09625 [Verrucomicrobiales bacterium]
MAILVEGIVVGQQILDQVIPILKSDAEELGGAFPFHGLLEASPADQKALLGRESLNGTDELVEDHPLDGGVGGFDLHADPGLAESERAGGGKEIDAVIRTGRGLVDGVLTGL